MTSRVASLAVAAGLYNASHRKHSWPASPYIHVRGSPARDTFSWARRERAPLSFHRKSFYSPPLEARVPSQTHPQNILRCRVLLQRAHCPKKLLEPLHWEPDVIPRAYPARHSNFESCYRVASKTLQRTSRRSPWKPESTSSTYRTNIILSFAAEGCQTCSQKRLLDAPPPLAARPPSQNTQQYV